MKSEIKVVLLSIVMGLTACGGSATSTEKKLVSVRVDSGVGNFCQGQDKTKWHDCQTQEIHVVANLVGAKSLSCVSTRTYSNGEIDGPYSNKCSIPEIINGITIDKKTVCSGIMVNGLKEGVEICTEPRGAVVSEIFYKRGEAVREVDVSERERERTLVSLKKKCSEIGYQLNTEKHADCVLRMIEIGTNNSSQTSTKNLSLNEQKLIQMQIQQLEQQQFDRKLEGNKELLEWAKKLTQ